MTNGNTRSNNTWEDKLGGYYNYNLIGDNLWFPAMGHRTMTISGGASSLASIGTASFSWSATPTSTTVGYGMSAEQYSSTNKTTAVFRLLNASYIVRSYGCAIRPVAEE